jgi:hypothetical protein
MQARFEHVVEEDLERYSVGTLPETEAEILEEHLLICPICQDRLAEIDEYVRAMRAAASKLRADDSSGRRRLLEGVSAGVAIPRLAWAGGGVLCLGLLLLASGFWHSPRTTSAPPVAVILQAVRGADEFTSATAPKGSPLVLEADLSGLPPGDNFRIEVVDARGALVQRLNVKREGGRLSAQAPNGLARGRYWVRLRASHPDGELLREYSLRVE